MPFVEIGQDGYDSHDDNFPIHKSNLGILDPAWSSLLQDLQDRGMLQDTLVVWTSEFGRTPAINGQGGRDHFGRAWTVVLAGGGIKGGRVVGASDAQGAFPAENAKTAQDVLATMYRHLGIDPSKTYEDHQGRPISILPHGTPVDELFA